MNDAGTPPYTHIRILPTPGSLNDVVDENSAHNQKVRAQKALALAAPDLRLALVELLDELTWMQGSTSRADVHNARMRRAYDLIQQTKAPL